MLRTILYVVIAVFVLSFFGITIQSILHSPAGEANFGFLGELVISGFQFVVNFIGAIIAWFQSVIHGTFT
jgi:hypothetical protein